jgi:hypothetical protein
MIEYTVKVFNNRTEWFNSKNQRHRVDGPACEYADDHAEWWINGKRHREDGPAIEYAFGDKEWWINGQRHREDGPAIEYARGSKSWYLNGEKLSETEFNNRNDVKEYSIEELQKLLGHKLKVVE